MTRTANRAAVWGMFVAVGLATISSASAQIIVTELMASNLTVHTDEDGDYSDWAEFYNPTAVDVDLSGWYLTDDALHLDKWRFPDGVTLPAGEFLLVYASDKDKRDPGSPLHTNFQLETDGEYFALVEPDGVSVAFDFGAAFPPQVTDYSYGLSQGASIFTLVDTADDARAFVPSGSGLGTQWRQIGFNDAGWKSGRTGVGYESGSGYESQIRLDVQAEMQDENTTTYIRIPFRIDDASSVSSLRFRMKYDDGYAAFLNGNLIASRNAPSTLGWNSSASSLHDDSAAVVFEEAPVPGAAAHLRDGENVLAIHGLNDNLGSSDFLILPELEGVNVGELDLESRHYFDEPSPGVPNFTGASAVSAVPTISEPSGTKTSSFNVALDVADGAATIRYTTNGNEPTASSTRYTGPISISQTTQLNVKSFTPDALPSPTVTANYIFLASSVRSVTSNLPIVYIDTFGDGIGSSSQTSAYASIVDVDPATGRARITDPPSFQHFVGMKQRGSSSSGFAKKQWAFEIWNAPHGNDEDAPLLDMPPESDWILQGPYSDKSLMRNVLSYDWSNRMGLWAVRTRFVEAYLNTGGGSISSSDYIGVYIFMEKIKRGRDRVDIARLLGSENTGDDVTGGYILKIDRLDPGDSGFTTSRGLRLAYVYPKEDRVTGPQANYIRSYMNAYETALYGTNYRSPTSGYRRYIDPASFIDHHIMVELTKNIDGFRLSTFMYKDKNGKLASGPIWDYNLSLGNADYNEGWRTSGWYYSLLSGNSYAWYPRLFQDPDFTQEYVDRWTELRETVFQTSELLGSVDEYAAEIDEAQARNFNRWRILGQDVWPNWFVADTWEEEIDWMKDWIAGRADWMDSQFTAPVSFNRSTGLISPGFRLIMSSSESPIYYTLDGTDPRRSGGGLSDSAIQYDGGGVTIDETTRVIARVRRSSSRWGAPRDEVFYTKPPQIGISEIMYHPPNPDPSDPFGDEDYEFFEIVNFGEEPVDLRVLRLAGGIEFDFADGAVDILQPGEYALVVENLAAFESAYDTDGMNVAGEYEGNLANGGDFVQILGPHDLLLREIVYADAWHPETDGGGYSLVIVDAWTTGDGWSDPTSWRSSTDPGGSPGSEDPGGAAGGRQRPGDANQDGSLDIADALSLLLQLFGGAARPLPCEGALDSPGNTAVLDVNGDEGVNVADALHLLAYLFQNGAPPALGSTCVRVEGCPSSCSF